MDEDLRYSSNGEKGSFYLYEPSLADRTDWYSRTYRPSVASRLLPLRLQREMKWCKTGVRLSKLQGGEEWDTSQGGGYCSVLLMNKEKRVPVCKDGWTESEVWDNIQGKARKKNKNRRWWLLIVNSKSREFKIYWQSNCSSVRVIEKREENPHQKKFNWDNDSWFKCLCIDVCIQYISFIFFTYFSWQISCHLSI